MGVQIPFGKTQFWGGGKGRPIVKYRDTLQSCAKTAEAVVMPLDCGLGLAQGIMNLMGSRSPHDKRQFWGKRLPIVKYRDFLLLAVQKQPFVLWTRVHRRKHKFSRIRQVVLMYPTTLCRELCKHGWTDRFAVWVVNLGGLKDRAQVQSYSLRHYFGWNAVGCCVVVRGSRPGKNVQLAENEIRGLCLKSREIFLSQPILLELEAPLKICG